MITATAVRITIRAGQIIFYAEHLYWGTLQPAFLFYSAFIWNPLSVGLVQTKHFVHLPLFHFLLTYKCKDGKTSKVSAGQQGACEWEGSWAAFHNYQPRCWKASHWQAVLFGFPPLHISCLPANSFTPPAQKRQQRQNVPSSPSRRSQQREWREWEQEESSCHPGKCKDYVWHADPPLGSPPSPPPSFIL